MSDMRTYASDRKVYRYVGRVDDGAGERVNFVFTTLIGPPPRVSHSELLRLYRCLAEDDGEKKAIMHLSSPAGKERRRFSYG